MPGTDCPLHSRPFAKLADATRIEVDLWRASRLNATLLPRTAAVVRNRSHIFNGLDVQASTLQRGDGAFATAPRTFHLDVDLFHSVLDRLFSSLLSRHLTGKRRALATAFESAGAGTGPAQRFTFHVRDRYRDIVKAGVDVRNSKRHIATHPLLFRDTHDS